MNCSDPNGCACRRAAIALAVADEVIAPVCGDCGLRVQRRLPDVRLRWMERDTAAGGRTTVLTSSTS